MKLVLRVLVDIDDAHLLLFSCCSRVILMEV